MRADIAASFQRVAVQHLEEKCRRGLVWAAESHPGVRQLVVAGGVAANQYIRARLAAVAAEGGLELVCPPPRLCTDNGVMVAWAGVERWANESGGKSIMLGWGGWFRAVWDQPVPAVSVRRKHSCLRCCWRQR